MTIMQEKQRENKAFEIPQSLSQTVARYLEKEIIEGGLKPSFRIVPEELAKRFKVSKSPIREALLSLEKDGLVTSKPRIGFFVTDIRLEDIENIYPIRAFLNALMFKTIIEKGYDFDFLPHLEKILHKMESRVRENDINGYFYLNVDLYDFFLNRCPNPRLRMILNQFGKQVHRFRFMTMSQPGHIKASLERHKRLFKALKDRDFKAATMIAEEIIFGALDVLQETFREKRALENP